MVVIAVDTLQSGPLSNHSTKLQRPEDAERNQSSSSECHAGSQQSTAALAKSDCPTDTAGHSTCWRHTFGTFLLLTWNLDERER